jgi:TldD protein
VIAVGPVDDQLEPLWALTRGNDPRADALVVQECFDQITLTIGPGGAERNRITRAGTGFDLVRQGYREYRHTDLLDPGRAAAALSQPHPPVVGQPPPVLLSADEADRVGVVAEEAAEVIRSHPPATPSVTAIVNRRRVLVLRSDGVARTEERLQVELRISARAGWATALRVVSMSDLGALTAAEHLPAAAAAAEAAVRMTGSVAPPGRQLPVVLGPGSPGALFHELCGHGLEYDLAATPGARFAPPAGRRVAAPLVSYRDDPRLPREAGLYEMDDEGTPATQARLIEQGELVGWLTDRAEARQLGRAGSGHGRRLDHTRRALPRMASSYVVPGTSRKEEVIADVPLGLYVTGIAGGEADMTGDEFSVRTSEAYLIERGRVTAPVRPVVLSGPVAEVLFRVDAVCDDLAFLAYGAQCGKFGHFPVTVSVGQPTVRISRLDIHPL